MNKKPIGVFDSGVGGLTVLEKLIEVFPNEDFVYVADQEHCPYGTKTNEEIENCVLNVGTYLLKKGVKAIVIACNTASNFIESLKKVTDIPIISVIDPTANEAIKKSKNKNIGVIATRATINYGKYKKILQQASVNVFDLACSEFVDFIENEDLNSVKGDELVYNKLSYFVDKDIDTLIYGCTHFSILEDKIKKVLGELNYIACGMPSALCLKNVLASNNLLSNDTKTGHVYIETTGNIHSVKRLINIFNFKYDTINKVFIY